MFQHYSFEFHICTGKNVLTVKTKIRVPCAFGYGEMKMSHDIKYSSHLEPTGKQGDT